jgi:hypothetical protein
MRYCTSLDTFKTGLTGDFTSTSVDTLKLVWQEILHETLINFLSSPDFFVGSDGVPSY